MRHGIDSFMIKIVEITENQSQKNVSNDQREMSSEISGGTWSMN